jgi:MoaE-MoaD fusion protein
MKINIEAFAILKDLFGQEMTEYQMPDETTAGKMLEILSTTFPNWEQILNVTRVAYRDEYLNKDEVLIDGESYALIPPVSGG